MHGNEVEYLLIPFNYEEQSFVHIWKNIDNFGNVIKRVTLKRDLNGNFVEQTTKIELEYDNQGNWISKKTFDNDSLILKTERQIIYF